MDPLSHALLGASVSGFFAKKNELRRAISMGALAAMAPDLDVVIRSKQNPLLWIEYHRHFTHSLLFVPLGALICAFVFWLFLRKKMSFGRIYFFSFLGYLTHGFLDACTSYGTLLLWPFSYLRVAWDNIGIIDLLYTLPLLACVIAASRVKRKTFIQVGLVISFAYLLFGVYQHHRAENLALKLIESRSQQAERLQIKPTVLNLFLWRSIYEYEGRYYVDALRSGPFLEDKIYEGNSVAKYDWQSEIQKLPANSILAKDIRIFAWFSGGLLYQSPEDPRLIADLRYSPLPQQSIPLWGIVVDPEKPNEHVFLKNFRKIQEKSFSTFFKMLKGEDLN